MKKFYLLITSLCLVFTIHAQNYPVGKRSLVFTDAARSNREIAADIFYPANATGDNTAVLTGTAQFPIVVFGHGYLIGTGSYEWLADSLATKGYIVVFPSTEGSLFPSHGNFGSDLLFLCKQVASLNDSAGSFLYQRVIKKAAVGGHSMGGGSSFLAAANGAEGINALFNFAAAETNPSATAVAPSITVPALIFSGSEDCVAAPSVQSAMYAGLAAVCKTYISINDGLHCQFANNNGTCALGQALTGCNTSSITPAIVYSKVTELLVPFLDYYLKDACTGGEAFTSAYLNSTGITKLQNCNVLPSCGPLPVVLERLQAKQERGVVNISWQSVQENNLAGYTVEKSMDGIRFDAVTTVAPKGISSQVAAYTVTDKQVYPGLSYYRLTMTDRDGKFRRSKMVTVTAGRELVVQLNVYPNPTQEIVYAAIVAGKTQRVSFSLYNTSGKLIHQSQVPVTAGLNKKSVSLAGMASGIYLLMLRNDNGDIIETNRILKQ